MYEINDAYAAAVALIISFIIGRIARNVIIKLCEKRKLNADNVTLSVRGGDGHLILKRLNQQDERLAEHTITKVELEKAIFVCINIFTDLLT